MLQHSQHPQQANSLLFLVPSVDFHAMITGTSKELLCHQESVHVMKLLKADSICFFKT